MKRKLATTFTLLALVLSVAVLVIAACESAGPTRRGGIPAQTVEERALDQRPTRAHDESLRCDPWGSPVAVESRSPQPPPAGSVAAGYEGAELGVPPAPRPDAYGRTQTGDPTGGRLARRALPASPPAPGDLAAGDAVDADGEAAPAPPGFSAREELWVIERRVAPVAPETDDFPGCGALMTRLPEGAIEVPVPLKHTDVKASVAGSIASVSVTQQFHNPYSSKIEAVYVFPLPENAAVSGFVMTIGERTIRGIVREREEARRIYEEARGQGYRASLLTQERPNIFTQRVANIEPGKGIDISITYFNTLPSYDGWYEFAFPMVVGPRFNPPGMTDGIGAAPRGAPGASGQSTEVRYLRPSERSGHDIALAVEVDAGVEIEEIRCRTHAVEVERPAPGRALVRLSMADRIPNRDFVLRYRVAGASVKSGILTEDGGHFTMMLVPPAELEELPRQPLEVVFVLDCSGSMSGRPIEQAKEAVERGLKRLRPGDSFQLINFSMSAGRLSEYPLEATPENIERGLRHLSSLRSEGGTMMIEGIKAALDFPHDPERLRFVVFLTDGYIGNEGEILRAIHEKLGASRIFSFGVGTSVNRFLMESMAKMGRGVVAYLGLHDPAADVMDLFFERIAHPALTDVEIDWGGARVSEVFPQRLPDLFVGRPVVLAGRIEGAWDGGVVVRGRVGGRSVEIPVRVRIADERAAAALPDVWARMKIADLSDRGTWDADASIAERIRSVALEYGLMSPFTSFVAVDSTVRTAGEFGTTVGVPVPVPEGVRYETTVPGGG